MKDKLTSIPSYDKVFTSYTGRVGCMCGCNGKYYYTSKDRDFSSKDRGYKVRDEEISDKAVKRAYNKISRLFEEGIDIDTGDKPFMGVNHAYYESGDRCCAFYFKVD